MFLLLTSYCSYGKLRFFASHSTRFLTCSSFSSATQHLDLPRWYKVGKQILSVIPPTVIQVKHLEKRQNSCCPSQKSEQQCELLEWFKTFPF